MTVSHNNEQIVVGSRDRFIIVLRLETGEIEHSIEQHTDAVVAVALTQDDAVLVSGLHLQKKPLQTNQFVVFHFSITRSNSKTLDISRNAITRYYRYYWFTYSTYDYL
jgi:WD40 repeat protein